MYWSTDLASLRLCGRLYQCRIIIRITAHKVSLRMNYKILLYVLLNVAVEESWSRFKIYIEERYSFVSRGAKVLYNHVYLVPGDYVTMWKQLLFCFNSSNRKTDVLIHHRFSFFLEHHFTNTTFVAAWNGRDIPASDILQLACLVLIIVHCFTLNQIYFTVI